VKRIGKMRIYLCVSKLQKEWNYFHANWQLIEAESRGQAKSRYVHIDGHTRFTDVLCELNTDSTMDAKLQGQGHPLAVAND